jgi:hypothetical protein
LNLTPVDAAAEGEKLDTDESSMVKALLEFSRIAQ